MFTLKKNYCICFLDDYSVQKMPEAKKSVTREKLCVHWNRRWSHRRYPKNDTDFHAPLKKQYRKLEQELMITQLRYGPKKIPQPTHDDMVQMLVDSLESIDVDIPARYKAPMLTSALDGSEDYLASEKIMSLVGKHLKTFSAELMKLNSLKQLRVLLKLITTP